MKTYTITPTGKTSLRDHDESGIERGFLIEEVGGRLDTTYLTRGAQLIRAAAGDDREAKPNRYAQLIAQALGRGEEDIRGTVVLTGSTTKDGLIAGLTISQCAELTVALAKTETIDAKVSTDEPAFTRHVENFGALEPQWPTSPASPESPQEPSKKTGAIAAAAALALVVGALGGTAFAGGFSDDEATEETPTAEEATTAEGQEATGEPEDTSAAEALEARAEELDEREAEIEGRSESLDERDEQLQGREGQLDEREQGLDAREGELDGREAELDERERAIEAAEDDEQ